MMVFTTSNTSYASYLAGEMDMRMNVGVGGGWLLAPGGVQKDRSEGM